jgi:hypothetical protein
VKEMKVKVKRERVDVRLLKQSTAEEVKEGIESVSEDQ